MSVTLWLVYVSVCVFAFCRNKKRTQIGKGNGNYWFSYFIVQYKDRRVMPKKSQEGYLEKVTSDLGLQGYKKHEKKG